MERKVVDLKSAFVRFTEVAQKLSQELEERDMDISAQIGEVTRGCLPITDPQDEFNQETIRDINTLGEKRNELWGEIGKRIDEEANKFPDNMREAVRDALHSVCGY